VGWHAILNGRGRARQGAHPYQPGLAGTSAYVLARSGPPIVHGRRRRHVTEVGLHVELVATRTVELRRVRSARRDRVFDINDFDETANGLGGTSSGSHRRAGGEAASALTP